MSASTRRDGRLEAGGGPTAASLDVARIRGDFPILRREVNGRPLVYLDSAATTQKPQVVIDALADYYARSNANVHRGIHKLAEEATEAYEAARARVARMIGADDPRGVVFTRNATEAINLAARAWVEPRLRPGDEILLTEMEHHSNLVPWIMIARRAGAVLRHVPIDDEGHLILDRLEDLIGPRTRILALTHASNVLGTINPITRIVSIARARGVPVLLDGAQSVPHLPIDLRDLGVDFLAFSAHKMLGPTGVGVLWARPDLLEEAEPFLGGGEMIREVTLDAATWNEIPWKFEAGTPNIAGVVGFGAALDYLESIGMDAIRAHEIELTGYAFERLSAIGGLQIHGPRSPAERTGVISFSDATVHPHDLATILDMNGVAIRAGHHCAQPLMRRLGAQATARASFYLYNDAADVDALVAALSEARSYFGEAVRRT